MTTSDKNLSKYLPMHETDSYMYLINEAWDNIIRIENKSRINFQFEFRLNSSFKKIGRLMNNSIFNY